MISNPDGAAAGAALFVLGLTGGGCGLAAAAAGCAAGTVGTAAGPDGAAADAALFVLGLAGVFSFLGPFLSLQHHGYGSIDDSGPGTA